MQNGGQPGLKCRNIMIEPPRGPIAFQCGIEGAGGLMPEPVGIMTRLRPQA